MSTDFAKYLQRKLKLIAKHFDEIVLKIIEEYPEREEELKANYDVSGLLEIAFKEISKK